MHLCDAFVCPITFVVSSCRSPSPGGAPNSEPELFLNVLQSLVVPPLVLLLTKFEPPRPRYVQDACQWHRHGEENVQVWRCNLLVWSRVPIEHFVHAEDALCNISVSSLTLCNCEVEKVVRTATAVPGKNVKVSRAIVFIAALSCLVSSATCAVDLAISMLSRLSRRLSSAILRELCASWMLSALSRCAMKLKIWSHRQLASGGIVPLSHSRSWTGP